MLCKRFLCYRLFNLFLFDKRDIDSADEDEPDEGDADETDADESDADCITLSSDSDAYERETHQSPGAVKVEVFSDREDSSRWAKINL